MANGASTADKKIQDVQDQEQNLVQGLLALNDPILAAQVVDKAGTSLPVAGIQGAFGPYAIQQVWDAMRECVRRGQTTEGVFVVDILREWALAGKVPPPSSVGAEWLVGSELYAREDWLFKAANEIEGYRKRQRLTKDMCDVGVQINSLKDDSEILSSLQAAYLRFDSDDAGWADGGDIARYFTDIPPEQEWLFQNCLPKYCLGVLAGPPGGSKGMLTLEAGLAIALGKDWFGYEARPGRMLYLSAEDHDDDIHRRFYRLAQRHRLSSEEMKLAGQNIRASYVGGDISLFKVTKEGDLARGKGFYKLQNAVRKFKPDLVAIDTWSKFSGVPENDNDLVSRACGILENEICIKLSCNLLVIAHTGKVNWNARENDDFSKALSIEAIRGASALPGSARWVMTVSPMPLVRAQKEFGVTAIGTKDQEFVAYRIAKNSNGPLGDIKFVHRLQDGTLESVVASKAESEARKNEMADLQHKMLEQLSNFPDGVSKRRLRDVLGVGDAKLDELIREMESQGKVESKLTEWGKKDTRTIVTLKS